MRLHRIDENLCSEVAPLLAYLRDLQRRFALAIVIVHHARKGAGRVRAGQALRGSSEFHAWLDSSLFLRRTDDTLTLTVEHRAEPSHGPIPVHLADQHPALALSANEATTAVSLSTTASESPAQRIESALAALDDAVTVDHLRRTCRMRSQTVCDVLAELVRTGRVLKTDTGYRLVRTINYRAHAQRRMSELRAAWEARGLPPFHVRIGLNTGDAIAGNIRSEDRLDFTAIGDSVNLASRLEELNKAYGTAIMLSASTHDAVAERIVAVRSTACR